MTGDEQIRVRSAGDLDTVLADHADDIAMYDVSSARRTAGSYAPGPFG